MGDNQLRKSKRRVLFIAMLLTITLFLLYKFIFTTDFKVKGEFVESYYSTDNKFKADVYEQSGNATNGVWTRVLIVENSNRLFKMDKVIYLKRKPYINHDIYWKDSETLVVNDIKLNIYNDEYIHPEVQDD